MATKNPLKNPLKFLCEKCDYSTCNSKDYKKHLHTEKHKSTESTKNPQKSPDHYYCECGKKYKDRSGLWRHKKKCSNSNDQIIKSDNTIDADLVKELILQNKELQKQLIQSNTIINNTTNNNTQNFNIGVFLNEHCKDAINFSDFIDNIKISHEDLQNNAQLGFVGGISKIITDNLKQLTLHERPIHCTDVKRETMYIKDKDIWQKEKELVQQKLNKAIREISRKSVVSLMKWKQSNPDYADMDSDFSTQCLAMQRHSMAGGESDKYYPKVIHRIAECVPCKGI
jgi:hypothetical protein